MKIVTSKEELEEVLGQAESRKEIVVVLGDIAAGGGKSQVVSEMLREMSKGYQVVVFTKPHAVETDNGSFQEAIQEFEALTKRLGLPGDVHIGRALNASRQIEKRELKHLIMRNQAREKTPAHERGRDKQAYKPRRRW